MRLLVCGGRDLSGAKALEAVWKALEAVDSKTPIELLIEGGAPGADLCCRAWAVIRRVPFHTEPADWKKYGRAAGPIRNAKMLQLKPDGVVAFPGGAGTADMCSQAEAAGLKVWRPYG